MGKPILRYESGQALQAFEEMTDSGDQTIFNGSFAPISNKSGFEPTIAPYGLLTGGVITPDAGVNDSVDVAALTVLAPGMTGADADGVVSVAADTVTITRAVSTDTHMINSITIDSTGAVAVVTGTDGTAFSETRGAAGGPPYIPVGSIEIGQVRTTSFTAAVVASSEIFQVVGTHQERSDYPVYELDRSINELTFADVLPAIHTGDLPKKVYIKGYTPIFAPIPEAYDFVPAEQSHSLSSTDTYDGAKGSYSSSLNQSTFSALLKDGSTDAVVQQKNENLWFEYRDDRDKTLPKILTQGVLGVGRAFPAGGGRRTVSCTITPESESVDVIS